VDTGDHHLMQVSDSHSCMKSKRNEGVKTEVLQARNLLSCIGGLSDRTLARERAASNGHDGEARLKGKRDFETSTIATTWSKLMREADNTTKDDVGGSSAGDRKVESVRKDGGGAPVRSREGHNAKNNMNAIVEDAEDAELSVGSEELVERLRIRVVEGISHNERPRMATKKASGIQNETLEGDRELELLKFMKEKQRLAMSKQLKLEELRRADDHLVRVRDGRGYVNCNLVQDSSITRTLKGKYDFEDEDPPSDDFLN